MINKDESKIIIVPWDFTHISEYALEYAINAAHALEKEIFLLHIVNKEATEEQEKEALKKLEKQAGEILQKYQIQVQPVVRKGSIFNVISDYASEVKAALVVMGTHGVTGTQKITGSWALKVIIGSKVPFLVVQEKPGTAVGFNKIVYRSISREKTKNSYSGQSTSENISIRRYIFLKDHSGTVPFSKKPIPI
jgi:nucleotide-binding universal stress UspA family protein